MANLKEYLRVGEAAEYLGVSPSTVRNWTRDGKLRAHRHPLNDYRLFDPRDLESFLRELRSSAPPRRRRKKSKS